jgi:putative transposase
LSPSTVAVVSESSAILRDLCPRVEPFQKEKRRLQRAMDRSRRVANPDNYEANGKTKNGAHKWIKSRRYINQKLKVAEQERRLAAERKRSHGELTNQILALGNQIKTEKLSYKSFQKNFGKSVKKQAPGMFVEMLRRKADAAGGYVDEFSTYSTKLSQTCHSCGSVKKKLLSLRVHECDCGVGPVQRDLYSAFLARHVRADKLDANQATLAWSGVEARLVQAASSYQQSAKPGVVRRPAGSQDPLSGSPANNSVDEAPDGVAMPVGTSESRRELAERVGATGSVSAFSGVNSREFLEGNPHAQGCFGNVSVTIKLHDG